jgi:predicted GIY-YIG superfamily endonuclease
MAIDGCRKTFAELAAETLPGDMERIRKEMQSPLQLTEFCTSGRGVRTIVKRLRKQDDFSGCYVLLRKGKPFYVGISRRVVTRLRQHGKGTTQFDASLAYRMAKDKVQHHMTRAAAMKDLGFRRAFDGAKRLLIGSSVAFIEIQDPVELYLFEAYCAMELDTHEWNTFRTH